MSSGHKRKQDSDVFESQTSRTYSTGSEISDSPVFSSPKRIAKIKRCGMCNEEADLLLPCVDCLNNLCNKCSKFNPSNTDLLECYYCSQYEDSSTTVDQSDVVSSQQESRFCRKCMKELDLDCHFSCLVCNTMFYCEACDSLLWCDNCQTSYCAGCQCQCQDDEVKSKDSSSDED